MSSRRALLLTAASFALVGAVWLALASFLPNFHVANTSVAARALFVGIVLLLLAVILVAQLAMLRAWFRSLQESAPSRGAAIFRLRVAVIGLVILGVVSGLAVLWYATRHWMPQVQRAVEDGARSS